MMNGFKPDSTPRTMRWEGDRLLVLDQNAIPGQCRYISCSDYMEVADAIRRLAVRGAPAIGAAAAFALLLGAKKLPACDAREFVSGVEAIADSLASTRPTAVNLAWALDCMLKRLKDSLPADPAFLLGEMEKEAHRICKEDLENNRKLGRIGQAVIPDGARILTHCNAGSLATAGYGTALGVIRAAREEGKSLAVYAGETRPMLQGSRLTAWEMIQEGISVTLITDSMAGYLMAMGKVDLVLLGADRIAANGDTANKIGTYSLAVLARQHGIPFYVAAPGSTFDLGIASGNSIPIEERDPEEVTHYYGVRVAPAGVEVWNPAFDITPSGFITAFITERGIIRPPYEESIKEAMMISREKTG